MTALAQNDNKKVPNMEYLVTRCHILYNISYIMYKTINNPDKWSK